MGIFSVVDHSTRSAPASRPERVERSESSVPSGSGQRITRRAPPPKPSDDEIRLKMAEKNKDKDQVAFSGNAPKSLPKEGEVDEAGAKRFMNDPNDTNTREKLKSVLSSGAVNFNGREKELLSKILAN